MRPIRSILAFIALLGVMPAETRGEDASPTLLTNAQQILSLGRDEAGRMPHPVRFRGVVTYPSIDVRTRIYVQDGLAGLMVSVPDLPNLPRKAEPGDLVDISGLTAVGALLPYVANAGIKFVGRAPLPEPVHATPGELSRGMHFGRRVAVSAVVRDVAYFRDRLQLLCAAEGHLFLAGIGLAPDQPLPTHWLDARLELRGNTWVTFDNVRRPTGFALAVYDTNHVSVIRPGNPDRFGGPLMTAVDFSRNTFEPDSRVHLSGVVTSWSPDGWFTLRDATGPVVARRLERPATFSATDSVPVDRTAAAGAPRGFVRPSLEALKPGARIELVAASAGDGVGAPRLIDAEYRVLGEEAAPQPRDISGRELESGRFDAELVRLRAQVLDHAAGDSAQGGEILWLEAEGSFIEARLDWPHEARLPVMKDYLVEVTGVCLMEVGSQTSRRAIRLRLRAANDLTIVRASPPALTTATAKSLGGAGALIALTLGWVWLLRRQVSRQTAALRGANVCLRTEVEQRTRAEEALNERVRLSSLSADVALALNAGDDLCAMLQRCVELLVQHLGVANARIWTLTDDAQSLELQANAGLGSRADRSPSRLAVADSDIGRLVRERRPIRVNALPTASPVNAGDWFQENGVVAWAGHPLMLEGRVLGVVAIFARHPLGDDTLQALAPVAHSLALGLERKRAEARLRDSEERFSKAFLGSSARLAILDAETGRYLDVNDAFVEGYGFSREEAVGRTSLELGLWQNPEDRAAAYRSYERDGRLRGFESRLRTRHGELRTVLQSGDFIKLGDRRCILSVGVDITDRKKAEIETQKALAREKELSELKSGFVSMVSHEFRTPLGVIQSASDVLDRYLDRLSPEKRRKHLDMIFRSTKNLAQLVEGVLLLGKAEDGRMQFTPAPLNLATTCAQIVDEVHSATGRSSPIEFIPGAGLEDARSDADLLRHILTNLLSNAVKYSSPGAPVELTLERRGADAVFTVRDRGIGIPEADQPNLFKTFARGGNVGARPGTGLGLVIVQRCVQLHGGTVTVASGPGEGTTVTVTLLTFPG